MVTRIWWLFHFGWENGNEDQTTIATIKKINSNDDDDDGLKRELEGKKMLVEINSNPYKWYAIAMVWNRTCAWQKVELQQPLDILRCFLLLRHHHWIRQYENCWQFHWSMHARRHSEANNCMWIANNRFKWIDIRVFCVCRCRFVVVFFFFFLFCCCYCKSIHHLSRVRYVCIMKLNSNRSFNLMRAAHRAFAFNTHL